MVPNINQKGAVFLYYYSINHLHTTTTQSKNDIASIHDPERFFFLSVFPALFMFLAEIGPENLSRLFRLFKVRFGFNGCIIPL
mmetsp:Transcript_20442/g.32982  ORF Transcript_20442/g.32982 Transcript_20442/m.32982 type:complete len:83 (-) Transcript_20442:833-1081(-)